MPNKNFSGPGNTKGISSLLKLMTAASMEEAAQKLPKYDAEDLRMRVCGILRSSKLLKGNIPRGLSGWGWEDEVILAECDSGDGLRWEGQGAWLPCLCVRGQPIHGGAGSGVSIL